MVAIAVQPFVLKDATFKVAADNYEKALSSVAFAPSAETSTVKWKSITPASSFSETTALPASWVCTLSYAQDWKTTNSLSRYLHEHEGESVTVVFVPKAGTGEASFTADLTVVPGSIGGDVDTVMVSSVSMPSSKPVEGTTP